MNPNTCVRCSSAELQPGKLWGYHQVRFVPESRRFLSLFSSVKVRALVCMNCGTVNLAAEQAAVAEIMK
ncbi:hypothetical protein [Lacipirellula sp.]|uniref:hypothetical protein n=1 Tax=Lacipirellula sp. TaxID=2691419 RepID=UPI003D0D9FB1